MDEKRNQELLKRVRTGITGLDTILHGGLLQGGIYLVMGQPGAGKTVLGNQICFDTVAEGGRAVYVTVLAESHARMLAHISGMSFVDTTVIGDALYYVSGYHTSEGGPLNELLDLLQRVIRDRKANLLVVDGMSTAEYTASSDLALKEFIYKLHMYAEAVGCTTLLLTHVTHQVLDRAEHTMVDGIIEFREQHEGMRALREIEVRKLRGSNYVRGKHTYEITDDGIVVHPRTEAVLRSTVAQQASDERVGFGIPQLNEMLSGGVVRGSKTLLFGTSGAGKTLIGLHFLAEGARKGEAGLYFGFNEAPVQLVEKGVHVGIDLQDALDKQMVEFLWQAAPESALDAIAETLLDAVRTKQVKRLFIDGLNALRLSDYPHRISSFFIALTNELSRLGITTVFSVEAGSFVGPSVELPGGEFSVVADNIIFLRYVELKSELHRLISIMKVQVGGYDTHLREFRITGKGIEVASTFESAEAVLTGIARPVFIQEPGNLAPPASPAE